MKTIAFVLGYSISILTAHAADTPKAGEDNYTIAYIVTSSKTAKFGDKTVTLLEFGGISLNDKGSGLFHKFGARCTGMREAEGTNFLSRGTCADSDADGDQIFSTYESSSSEKGKPATGVHTFVGGTGKYTGITGKADYSVQPIKSVDGPTMFLVPHKATWKLP